ncbi:MAG TPA: SOS response-associated peptidase family protein, partial [Opitutaceae bacterium]
VGRAKQPWYFRWRDEERPILFAGLWESWRGPDGDALESCAIVTTEPNDVMRPVHNRMPAILATADAERWLDPAVTDVSALSAVLRPSPAAEMTATRLDDYVSNVQHEGPECLAPAKGLAASQLSLF